MRVSTQEWCGPVRGSSERGYKGDKSNGATLLQRGAERHGVVQHGEEVVYGWPNCSLLEAEGTYMKDGETLFKSSCGGRTRIGFKLRLGLD